MSAWKRFELAVQVILFSSRWLLAPFYFALAFSMFILLIKAGQHVIHLAHDAFTASESTVVVDTLGLIDLTLTGSLVVLVIFSGFENFVSKVAPDGDDSRPQWLSQIDFGGLKLKLMSSIAAISAIQLLRVFMDVQNQGIWMLGWSVGIHLSFVLSAVLMALSDRISAHGGGHGAAHAAPESETKPAEGAAGDGGH